MSYSTEMSRRLIRRCRRIGLPLDFVLSRCTNCPALVKHKFKIASIIVCYVVLCPYIGKGYIRRKLPVWLKVYML